jgi:hypothetical protein
MRVFIDENTDPGLRQHQQTTADAIDEMVAAGEPEIVHQRSPRTKAMRG